MDTPDKKIVLNLSLKEAQLLDELMSQHGIKESDNLTIVNLVKAIIESKNASPPKPRPQMSNEEVLGWVLSKLRKTIKQ